MNICVCIYTHRSTRKKGTAKKKVGKVKELYSEEMDKADKHEELQIKTMMRYYFIPVRLD